MYPIVRREKLADKIYLMDVEAPRVAKHCQPGQFVIVKLDEKGERVPLTICDYDREAGTVTIVLQTIGASTEKMSHLIQMPPSQSHNQLPNRRRNQWWPNQNHNRSRHSQWQSHSQNQRPSRPPSQRLKRPQQQHRRVHGMFSLVHTAHAHWQKMPSVRYAMHTQVCSQVSNL